MLHWLGYTLGLVVVASLCARRFNLPGPVRTHTTFSHYYAGLLSYVVIGIVLYNIGYLVLRRQLEPVALPIVAIVVQLMLWRVPGPSHLDTLVREKLYMLIGYPMEAQRLAASVARAPLSVCPDVQRQIELVLTRRGYELGDNWLPAAGPVRDRWESAAVLFEEVRAWERDRRYSRFLHDSRQEYDSLRQQFDLLSLRVVGAMRTIEELGAVLPAPNGESDGPGLEGAASAPDLVNTVRKTVNSLLAGLQQDVTTFHAQVCKLIARGVLSASFTRRQREQRLLELGITDSAASVVSTGVLTWAFLIYLAVFLCLLGLPSLLLQPTFDRFLQEISRSSMIALIQISAVFLAIVPKAQFGFANETCEGRTPWLFVIGAGLAAMLVAVLIQLPFLYVLNRSFWQVAPWLVMPFTTAATLAFLIQDSRWSGMRDPRAQRALDSLLLIVTTMIALGIAWTLKTMYFPEEAGALRPPWWYQPATALLISIGIGSFVPSHVRRAPVWRSGQSGLHLLPTLGLPPRRFAARGTAP